MSADTKILDRLRKLIALSKGTTEHEAALAADLAAQLMAEHNLAEADLYATSATVEIAEDTLVAHGRRVAWIGQIALGVAALVGGRQLWRYDRDPRTDRIRSAICTIVGTPDAVASARYLFPMFCRAVTDLADAAWDTQRPLTEHAIAVANERRAQRGQTRIVGASWEAAVRSAARRYKASFRTECAARLAHRMNDAAKQRHGAAAATASEHALVIRSAIDRQLDARLAGIRAARDAGPSNAAAYFDGIRAAETIALAAEGGALGAPALQLTAGDD